MTSSVLQNKIPYSIMYPDIDLFPLTPKIFESLCFVYNHIPYKTKLDYMSLKGFFLGYSRTQNCYKYFCRFISRYILSTDVIFLESKLGISTSPSSVSEDDYAYLFYQRHYSIVVSPHLKI